MGYIVSCSICSTATRIFYQHGNFSVLPYGRESRSASAPWLLLLPSSTRWSTHARYGFTPLRSLHWKPCLASAQHIGDSHPTQRVRPMTTLPVLHWHRLRQLVLQGETYMWDALPAPLVLLLSTMPGLHALSLKTDLIQNILPLVVWPPGYIHDFPWPELEHLSVSYPDPNDEVYDHLPPTLRSLSLRCGPQYVVTMCSQEGIRLTPSGWGLDPVSVSTISSITEHSRS